MRTLIELYKTDRPTAKLFTGMLVIQVGLAVVMVIEFVNYLIK
jgi:hypothetical protein